MIKKLEDIISYYSYMTKALVWNNCNELDLSYDSNKMNKIILDCHDNNIWVYPINAPNGFYNTTNRVFNNKSWMPIISKIIKFDDGEWDTKINRVKENMKTDIFMCAFVYSVSGDFCRVAFSGNTNDCMDVGRSDILLPLYESYLLSIFDKYEKHLKDK